MERKFITYMKSSNLHLKRMPKNCTEQSWINCKQQKDVYEKYDEGYASRQSTMYTD